MGLVLGMNKPPPEKVKCDSCGLQVGYDRHTAVEGEVPGDPGYTGVVCSVPPGWVVAVDGPDPRNPAVAHLVAFYCPVCAQGQIGAPN